MQAINKIYLIFIGCLLCISPSLLGETVSYTPDNTTNFCNPERGFYYHSEQKVTTAGTTNLSTSTFATPRSNGSTLLLRLYYLDNFRTKYLPEAVLNQITSDFALFRNNGCKAVLRFAYDNDNDDGYTDGSPAIWKNHLLQLKPILQANADVIAVVQAGFMGAWGEWYFSSQGEGDEIPQKVKNDLIDELLDAVPASRSVQLRTPDYKRDYFKYRKESTDALSAKEAFTGSARARLGHHNDAFLYQSDNMGTYSNRTADMNFLDEECLYLPNGGETDVNKESVYKAWATGDKAQAEMAKLHYSYLNQGYCATTINHWREDGSFDILARHMGYRLQLLETSIASTAAVGSQLPIQLTIRNIGYAPMYNERKAYVVLRNKAQTYTFLLKTDPRTWLPNGAISTIKETLDLPATIQAGTYDVCLWLPDMGDKIKNDSRFAVRLANKDVWEDETGYNVLTKLTIAQQGGGKDPDPEPSSDVAPVTNFRAKADSTTITLAWTSPNAIGADSVGIDLSTGEDVASSSASATVTYTNSSSNVSYTSAQTWQWAGVEFPVANLEDIASIGFQYKGDGSSNVLYPYAWDGDYRWRSEEYIDLSSTSWSSFSFTPSITLWADDPEHSFGDEPVTHLGFIVNPSKATSGTFAIRNLYVKFKPNSTVVASNVRIIRKKDSAPSSYSDGDVVYFGTDTTCVDLGLKSGATYYYAAYAIETDGTFAYPATCSVVIGDTAHQEIETSAEQCLKYMHDGKLYILHNGHAYTVLGQDIVR